MTPTAAILNTPKECMSMAKANSMTAEQVRWLRSNHPIVMEDIGKIHTQRRQTYKTLANHVGVCVDTVKRILVAKGIANLHSEKHVASRRSQVVKWSRPCMICKSNLPRPKNKFICTPCKNKLDWDDPD